MLVIERTAYKICNLIHRANQPAKKSRLSEACFSKYEDLKYFKLIHKVKRWRKTSKKSISSMKL